MRNKGQVTIFIILGVLIVLFVALFFIFTSFETQKPETQTQAVAYALIAQCVEDVAIHGIPFLAARGGYYEIPSGYLVYTEEYNPYFTTISYYYNEGAMTALSEDELATQFELFLLSRTKECYNSTSESSDYSFKELGTEEVTVSFTDYAVEILYASHVALVDATSTTSITPIEIALPSSYYTAYTTALAIAEEQSSKGNIFCMTCLTKYKQGAIENVLTEEVSSDNFYAIVYTINFTEESTDATALFSFAGKYGLASETENLRLLPIADQTIVIGYPYEYDVSATKTAVTFSDNSDLFDINPSSGIISFYPDEESVGTHLIEITATDSDGNFDSTSFYLEINPVVSFIDLSYIGTLAASVGQSFNYTVSLTEETNKTVYYFDDTTLFDVGLTSGKVLFTPVTGQEGTYDITFTATTQEGSTAEELMTLVIY
ncbi:hypothetical protein HZC31_05150 [Candidatus Woesearchaeota archaeon]|nr:hypothetical protein [Candidatus Woesearchaeota archaeon]